jgi:hypothetical protein
MAVKAVAAHREGRLLTAATLLPLTTAALVLWQIGAYVDAWYHLHYSFEIETFFTWPHALLYAGWVATGLLPALALGEGIGRGLPRRDWLPAGYPLVLAGSVLFGLGGAFDFIWHSLVGFEARQEAILAPSHLWLAIAFMVSAFGLLQAAALQRARAGSAGTRLRAIDVPMVLMLAVFLRYTLWYSTYAAPLGIDFAAGGAIGGRLPGYAGIAWANEAAQIAGVMGILLHSLALALFLVVPLRWLRLPTGALAIIVLYDAALIALPTDMARYLPAALGAALVAEALWAWVRRGGLGGPDGEAGYWAIGATTPLVLFALYLALAAAIGGGLVWTAHLWVGVPVTAGIIGLVASVLGVPPRFIREAATPSDGVE